MLTPLADDDPRVIGPFTIEGRLGAGAMGVVYLGRTGNDTVAAIKLVRAELAEDLEFRRRFRQEVDAVGLVRGPHTASLVGADTECPRPWLATEYLPGLSLRDVVATRGPLPAEEVVALASGIAAALVAIHAAGVVHRDLKPGNVILLPDGPRVIDFGIARATDGTSLTATGVTVGTPAYLAPEQICGDEVGPAADVFALGGLLAYLATGGTPFGDGPTSTVLYRIVHEPSRLDAIPDPPRTLIAWCLDKDPARRPTPAQLASAEPVSPTAPPARRLASLMALAVSLLVLAAAVVVTLTLDRTADGTPVAGHRSTDSTAPPTLSCTGTDNLQLSGSALSSVAVEQVLLAYRDTCPALTMNYRSMGTGAGIQDFIAGTAAMAVTDRPLQPGEERDAAERCGGEPIQLPFVANPIVLPYHLPGVDELNLDAPTIVKIFDGRIINWADPAIAALNPNVALPAQPVTAAYVTGESTTTAVFQNYLTVMGEWTGGTGPVFGGTGAGMASGSAVRSVVAATPGGIGYSTLPVGATTPTVRLRGAAPTLESVAATVHSALKPDTLTLSAAELFQARPAGGVTPYPLVSMGYAVICPRYPEPGTATALRDLLLASLTAQREETAYLLPTGQWATRLRDALQ